MNRSKTQTGRILAFDLFIKSTIRSGVLERTVQLQFQVGMGSGWGMFLKTQALDNSLILRIRLTRKKKAAYPDALMRINKPRWTTELSMGNVNRKITKQEKAHATRVINEAFPEMIVEWGSHSAYGGHRAPRDHTIAFRIKDKRGKYRSNVVWLMPDQLASLTPESWRLWSLQLSLCIRLSFEEG